MLAARPPLPAIVVGGYLGSGKTTLVNHLLRHAGGRRIAVMVNDFGEVGIDADLVIGADGDVLNLAGGCVCCSFGSDLVEALMALPKRVPVPELVLIETSGVALPSQAAAAASLAPGIRVEATVVLVDAETVRERTEDRYVGDVVRRQLAQADWLLLNKTDLVDPEHLEGLADWLEREAPLAGLVRTQRCAVSADLFWNAPWMNASGVLQAAEATMQPLRGNAETGPRFPSTSAVFVAPARQATDVFISCSLTLDRPTSPDTLASRLADRQTGLLRFKGLVRDPVGQWNIVQGVGRRHETYPADDVPGFLGTHPHGVMVCIASAEQGSSTALQARIQALLSEDGVDDVPTRTMSDSAGIAGIRATEQTSSQWRART